METSKKEKSSGPMGSGMFEIMKNCCSGEGLSDCCSMMKGMNETMRSSTCCTPQQKGPEPEEKKK